MKKATETADIDALLAAEITHAGNKCFVFSLSGVAKQVYERGMQRTPTEVPSAALARALRKLNVRTTDVTISRHRRGECQQCQRT